MKEIHTLIVIKNNKKKKNTNKMSIRIKNLIKINNFLTLFSYIYKYYIMEIIMNNFTYTVENINKPLHISLAMKYITFLRFLYTANI